MKEKMIGARIACLDVPALPLQLLRRVHPDWAGAPLAVVEADKPEARILFIDEAAARHRVRTGMRYAAALQLTQDLRASPVPERALAAITEEIVTALQARTPRVEPDASRPGVFWLDPSGLTQLFGPLEQWARHVHGGLAALGLTRWVTVGFARLPTWAVGRVRQKVSVIESAAEEARLAGRAPLISLDVPAEIRDALALLGIRRLEGFLALDRGEVGVRFGPEARALHALFADAVRPPMQPLPFVEPVVIEAELDPPDDSQHRLLFSIKGGLHALMAELARRALALRALQLTFLLECAPPHHERIEPARATRDAVSVLELVRLRTSDLALPARVEGIRLEAEPARLDGSQLTLFAGRRKDPTAAARSIARLRATFGDEAVTRAELASGWLPEDRFRFVPTRTIEAPAVIAARDRVTPDRVAPDRVTPEIGPLIRRVHAVPIRIERTRDGRPELDPPLCALTGPYRIENGWWETESARDYYFAEQTDGALLWLFRERRERRWYVHGRVE